MTEENKTEWEKIKELAETDEQAKKQYEEMKKDSAARRNKSYHDSIKRNGVYAGRAYNLSRKEIPEIKERNKLLSAAWYQENKAYRKMYDLVKGKNGFYFNLRIYKKWVSEGSDPDSFLLCLNPSGLEVQRREYD